MGLSRQDIPRGETEVTMEEEEDHENYRGEDMGGLEELVEFVSGLSQNDFSSGFRHISLTE